MRETRSSAIVLASMILLVVLSFMSQLTAAVVVSTVTALRNEINGADPSIQLSPGVYNVGSALQIARTVAIFASRPGTVVLSGGSSNRIFELLLTARVTLSNLTLVDGRGEGPPLAALILSQRTGGGCIAAYTLSLGNTLGVASSLILNNVEFKRCRTTTGSGGAIMLSFPFASTFRCTNCTFEENTAASEDGGAIFYEISPLSVIIGDVCRVDSSVFRNNSAQRGGAVFINSPSQETRFDSVDFRNNRATVGGGALALTEDMAVTKSRFEGNDASGQGNAVFIIPTLVTPVFYPTLTLDNSTVFTNNGGINGIPNPAVIKHTNADQVRIIVTFTPAPTSPPVQIFPTAPPITLPPSSSQPTVSSTSPSSQGMDFTGAGVGVSLGVLVMMMALVFVAARRRRMSTREMLANQQRAAEAQHNAFAHRRKRPKVVHIEELMPPSDTVESSCSICGEARADMSTINRCTGTISANKYKINNVPALTSMLARLQCGHVYHAACLIVWTEVNDRSTCPTCRHEVAFDDNRRASSFNSTDSNQDKPGSGRYSNPGGDVSAATMNASQMVIAVPADSPFSHEARRSANHEDQQHEQNAILVRELDKLQVKRLS